MVSLWIVVLTLAIVGVGVWFLFRFFAGSGELKKEPYRKIPPQHPQQKRRA